MTYVPVLLSQTVVMAIYMAVGYVLNATGLVSKEGNKGLSNLLLYVILPCVIVNSFLREATADTTRALLIAFALGALLVVAAMIVSRLLFRHPVDIFSASFSNAGFMGIPLIAAVLGSEYVIYAAGMVALLNILQWTYGQSIMDPSGKGKGGARALIRNPLIISLLLGILLYFLPVSLPAQIKTCVQAFANCNAPVAMCIIGFFLRELPIKRIFNQREAYLVSAARLLLIPLISILLIFWMPWISQEVKIALIILASAPVGSNVAIYAQRLGQDHARAVTEVCLSTVFSLITMPLVLLLMSLL